MFQDPLHEKICWSMELLLFLYFFILYDYFVKIVPRQKSNKSITNIPLSLLVCILLMKNSLQLSELIIEVFWHLLKSSVQVILDLTILNIYGIKISKTKTVHTSIYIYINHKMMIERFFISI